MPVENTLLSDEGFEGDLAYATNPEIIRAPDMGYAHTFFNAASTEISNLAVSQWNELKAGVYAQGELPNLYRKQHGMPEVPRDTPEDRFYGTATRLTEFNPNTTHTFMQGLGSIAGDLPLFFMGAKGADIYGDKSEQLEKQRLMSGPNPLPEVVANQVASAKGVQERAFFLLNELPIPGAVAGIKRLIPRVAAKAAIGVSAATSMDYLGSEYRANILREHGYLQQADQLEAWDKSRIAADAITGVLMTNGAGEVAGAIKTGLKDIDVLAALHIRRADDLLHESAPGIPTDANASSANAEAVRKALDDIAHDRPVDVSQVDGIHDAHFLAFNSHNIADAKGHAADWDRITGEYENKIAAVQKDIEKARWEGRTEDAEHLERDELTWMLSVRKNAASMAEEWHADVFRLENPEAYRAIMEQHQNIQNEMRTTAEDMRQPIEGEPPTGAASDEKPRDIARSTDDFLAQARRQAAGDISATPHLPFQSPEMAKINDELSTLHRELYANAEKYGTPEEAEAMRSQLDEALKAHQLESLEASKFKEAALCAIGL